MNSYSLYTTDTDSTGILLCRAIQRHMERFGELLVMIKSNDIHTYTPRPIDSADMELSEVWTTFLKMQGILSKALLGKHLKKSGRRYSPITGTTLLITEGLCKRRNITPDTLHNWEKKESKGCN